MQTIRLTGCVDISAAAELKRVLMEALNSDLGSGPETERGLSIDVNALESVDVTAVQLLWAARRQAQAAGREFRFDGPWTPELESLLHQAGISPSRFFAMPQEEMGRTSGFQL
jgi:anti-anti-sigma regulatory factor